MPAGELDGGTPRPFRGFSSNADDTPRDIDYGPPEDDPFEDEPFQDDPFEDEPQAFDTFEPPHGPLRLVPQEDWEEARPAPNRLGAAGAALLALLAAGVGFVVTRGDWISRPTTAPSAAMAPGRPAVVPPPAPADRAAPAPAITAQTEASTNAAPALTASARRDRPAPAVSAAPSPVRAAEAPRPSPKFVDSEVSSNASASLAVQHVAPPAIAPPRVDPDPAPVRPSFDCHDAQTPSQRMVCSDPRLAAADRRMSRAYAAALAAGGPHDQLDAEQADWLAIREDAARYSSRAVLNVYQQRTRELEAMVAEEPQ